MHLTKRILSFIVAEALRDKTWAESAVFDSPGDIGSIRVQSPDGGIFIAVYCDEWDMKSEQVPDETPERGPGTFKLIIEVGAAKAVTTESDDEGPLTQIAATDEGLEWSIAMISRQCTDTLTDTRPAFPWSSLFQRFISGGLYRYHIRRGGPANDGRAPAPRYASCVSIFKVTVCTGEPPRGQMVTPTTFPLWSDLLTMMSEREDLAKMATLIRAHFEPVDGKDLSEAVVDAARMWVSAESMATLGLAPETAMQYSRDAGLPSGEPVRHDVPLDEADMQQWLATQAPDASQGPGNGG